MLIIFEGPDGAGKTTLINRLKQKHIQDALICKRTSWKHFNKNTSSYSTNIDRDKSIFYDWRFFFEMHEKNFASHMFLCDRSFITYDIYYHACSNLPIPDDILDVVDSYYKELKRFNHLVIYTKNANFREEPTIDWINNDTIPKIHKHYDDFFNDTDLNKVIIDTEKYDVDTSVSIILGAIYATQNNYASNSQSPIKIIAC